MTIPRLQNPYVGPRPFQTGETLYGRDQEIMDLLDLLIAERIVLLYSPSGAGKTSLIQAGLIPELEAEEFQVLPVMRVSLEPPPEQMAELSSGVNRYILSVLLSLEEGLPEERQLPLMELAGMTLGEYLERQELTPRPPLLEREGESLLPSPARRGAGGEVLGSRLVLIFDQFEEILTVDPTDRAVKAEFFAQVGAALRHPDRWALFSMREEFPAGLDPYLRAVPTRLSTTFRLELLGRETASQAMQEPARQAGIPFTETAAAKLINDLRTVRVQQPDGRTEERPGLYVEPVQLQVVCHRLWNHLPEGTTEIQDAHIQDAGDVSTALAGYYADTVQTVSQATRIRERAIREWFDKHLITEQGIRGQVLRGPQQSQGLDNQAIAPLVDAHLVRAENRRGATWYELAHDRLIEPVRTNNAEWFEEHLSPLQQQSALWEQQNRSSGLLLRDEALEESEKWAAEHKHELTLSEQDFLTACREVRRQTKRERLKNRFILGLAIVAVIISIFAIIQWQASQRLRLVSVAQSLAVQALRQEQLEQDELGALLARQAYLFNQQSRGNVLGQVDEALRSVLNTGHFSRILHLNREAIAVAVSPDGNYLAAGGSDGSLEIWNLDTFPPTSISLQGHKSPVWSVAFSPDGRILASGGWDKTVRLWNLTTPEAPPVILRGHEHIVFAVAFHPDGRMLASGSLDHTIRLWDVQHPETDPTILRGHHGGVTAVTFSSNGRTLLSGSADTTLRLWDLEYADSNVVGHHDAGINAIALSPSGNTAASGSSDTTIRLWNLRKPETPPVILSGHEDRVTTLAFSPDGDVLFSGGFDLSLHSWDLRHSNAEPVIIGEHDKPVLSVLCHPDGKMLISGGQDNTLRLWDLTPSEFGYARLNKHQGAVKFIAFRRGAKSLVSVSTDRTVLLWPELSQDTPPDVVFKSEQEITAAAFSPETETLVIGDQKGKILFLQLDTADISPVVHDTFSDRVQALAISQDGRFLAANTGNLILVWDLQEPGHEPHNFSEHWSTVTSLAFSRDGDFLASGGKSGMIYLWNWSSSSFPEDFRGYDQTITALAFSSDRRLLASSSRDESLRLWDLRVFISTFAPLWMVARSFGDTFSLLPDYEEQTLALTFSPDGKFLATGGEDKVIRLWNPQEPRTIPLVFSGHQGPIESIAFSLDSTTLASGSQDGEILVWELTNSLAEAVCQKVWRNLTPEEWRRFVSEDLPYELTCPDF